MTMTQRQIETAIYHLKCCSQRLNNVAQASVDVAPAITLNVGEIQPAIMEIVKHLEGMKGIES